MIKIRLVLHDSYSGEETALDISVNEITEREIERSLTFAFESSLGDTLDYPVICDRLFDNGEGVYGVIFTIEKTIFAGVIYTSFLE